MHPTDRRLVREIATFYVEIIRGVPVLVLLFYMAFVAAPALVGLYNLVTTPHLAAMAADNFAPVVKRMFANMQHVSRGEPVPPLDLVV